LLSRYSDWLRAGRSTSRSSRPSTGNIFSFPRRPDWFWGPHRLLCNGHRELFHRGVKLITLLQLVLRSRMLELYTHSPIRLHGVMLNQLGTGTTLSFTGEVGGRIQNRRSSSPVSVSFCFTLENLLGVSFNGHSKQVVYPAEMKSL
jgi:hypothetical protein